ncbi:MAG: GGDEF domain-containing protein [Ruminococcus sp.]|nr:GGDEF domain-containing protein [Ruminococcus sp.]
MDTGKILNALWSKLDRNTIITDKNGEAVYISPVFECPAERVLEKIKLMPQDMEEMEFFDLDISIKRTDITCGGEEFACFTVSDISEYTSLVKEIAAYSKMLSGVSAFQTGIMKRLSEPYDSFLPGLCKYCATNDIFMIMKTDTKTVKSTFDGEKVVREQLQSSDDSEGFLEMDPRERRDSFYCIASSQIQQHRYAVVVNVPEKTLGSRYAETSINSMITLFVENSVLRDEMIFDSEHDRMTGLYNKGKYMALQEELFGKPAALTIYNFDVNNLKYINDNYGHEQGDALILKAAKSIAAVTAENVLGFRMGGDEFVMIAKELTAQQADELRRRWESELEKLNGLNDGLFCAVSCGMAHGSGDYVYDELYELADVRMYENKKAMKQRDLFSHYKANK